MPPGSVRTSRYKAHDGGSLTLDDRYANLRSHFEKRGNEAMALFAFATEAAKYQHWPRIADLPALVTIASAANLCTELTMPFIKALSGRTDKTLVRHQFQRMSIVVEQDFLSKMPELIAS